MNTAKLILLLLLLPLFLALLTACRPQQPVQAERYIVRYTTAKLVADSQHKSNAAYIGIVHGDVETELSFKVSGILELIGTNKLQSWDEGTPVKQGTILAQLKQADFSNNLNMAQAKAELDRKQYARNEALLKTGAISQQEFDVLAANKRSSEAAQAQAEQALRDSTLLCPFDGTILGRWANAGETISAGKPILRVANLRTMSIELGIPDRLLPQFQVGNKVPVNISALEGSGPYIGEVSEVGVAARSDARLFRVVLKVLNAKGQIKSGMTASVPIGEMSSAKPGAVSVPLSALVTRNIQGTSNELAVFVIDSEGIARERPVKTGDFLDSSIIINEGLQPDQKVVVVGAATLYDGARVDAREATPFQQF